MIKVFGTVFAVLGLVADLALPFWWAIAATITIGIVSCGWPIAVIGSDPTKSHFPR